MSCDCGCDDLTCSCWWSETNASSPFNTVYFKVPCYFKAVFSWPSFCGESVTTFCFNPDPVENYFETDVGWSKQSNRSGGSSYNASGNGVHLWLHPSASACSTGVRFLIAETAGWTLKPSYDFTTLKINWRLDLVSSPLAGVLATYELDDWDPWGTRNDGTFTLISVNSITERMTCRTTLTPNVSNNISNSFPATLTVRPQCFQPGCSNQQFVFGETFPPAGSCYPDTDDCEVGNATHSHFAPCELEECEWEYDDVTETWSVYADNCTSEDCDCGPGPVCGTPAGPPYLVLNESCYQFVTVSSMLPPYMAAEDDVATVTEPPLLRKIRNAAAQLIDSGKQLADGGQLVAPDDVQAERFQICQGCPHSGYGTRTTCGDVQQSDGTVVHGCGCKLALAIATAAKACPVGKWPAV